MKTILLASTLLASLGFADTSYSLSCRVTQQPTQGGYKISSYLSGTILKDEGRVELSNYRLTYIVYADGEEWGRETVSSSNAIRGVDYDGTTYQNHVKFNLPARNSSAYIAYPRGNESRFQAHLVVTGFNDHFGGTAHMNCRTTRN